jgi:DNA-binding NarL/FixJ family response regulator
MAQPTRVLIVDDSARAREGLRALLVTWPGVVVVGEAVNGQDAIHRVVDCRPDVVLMDLHMPVLDGVQATQQIKRQWPTVTVIVLTMYMTEQQVALAAGADAFVVKGSSPDRLLNALGLGSARRASYP